MPAAWTTLPLRGPLGNELQQRRLTDPSLAAQDTDRALSGPGMLELAIECLAFGVTASQHYRHPRLVDASRLLEDASLAICTTLPVWVKRCGQEAVPVGPVSAVVRSLPRSRLTSLASPVVGHA